MKFISILINLVRSQTDDTRTETNDSMSIRDWADLPHYHPAGNEC